jgi:acyl-coenzyme A synthetase/AMP-(fatty) acid ligase
MASLPLIAHAHPSSIVAYRAGTAITAAEFLAAAHSLAARLPVGMHVLNACADRYRFTVGLAATLISGRCSVLPSTQTPEVMRHLRAFAPDVFCLTDDEDCPIDLPTTHYQETAGAASSFEIPSIDAEHIAAYVFTSGSTGTPIPHPKPWGQLVACVRAEMVRLAPIDRAACAIVGTVPAQHMYGFESTVLLALLSGSALCAERPFFPADIAATLDALPRPRVLFSTPVHLRALLAAGIALPPVDLIVSATAMLSANTARDVEERYQAPLLEIYGSTETGQIATRRTALEAQWQLWPGVSLSISGNGWVAQGGHLTQPTPLADVLELIDEQHFLLHGRTADLVNIAGKRNSLGYLNHQLNAIPGVIDGAFYMREDADDSLAGSGRLAALAVAPGMDAAAIIRALRERIDAVFLPRPLLLVEQLPRNDTGKLPQHLLREIAAQAAARHAQQLV